MSSGADLFVVCKQCGAEVSPYITECPYCGGRLRKRAPKLPRERLRGQGERPVARPHRGRVSARAVLAPLSVRDRARGVPVLTITIIASSALIWILDNAGAISIEKLQITGPLHGGWWRLLTYQLAYQPAGLGVFIYGAVTLSAIAIFGSLVEQRYGLVVTAALYLGSGVMGALAALAIYSRPLMSGASAGALALLAAWTVPELRTAASRSEGDLDVLGVGAFALLLLAIPIVVPAASWTGALIGLAVGALFGAGIGLSRAAA
jgi:membrane associated rhomboid family serine protease/DNA-directed RNA polymerase subunit RPC12/RpoP